MPAGLTIANDSLVQIIDETYVCLALRSKGVVTATTQSPASAGGLWRTTTIGYQGSDRPILALHKARRNGRTDELVACLGSSYSPTSNTWTFLVLVASNPAFGGADYSVEYFIFDRPVQSPSLAGMEVYDGSGAIVFSTAWKQMNVRGSAGHRANVTGLPNGKYAVCHMSGISVANDTYEVSTSNGVEYYNRWRSNLDGNICQGDGTVAINLQSGRDNDYLNYQYSVSEAAGASYSPTTVVDVGGL